MICIRLDGGLGNQMFQYACGRALSLKHSTDLTFDISLLTTSKDPRITKRRFELEVFEISGTIAKDNEIKSLKPLFLVGLNVLSLKLRSCGIQFSNYFIENSFSYNYAIEKIARNCYLAGYWQSERYFSQIEDVIRKDFSFRNDPDESNARILERIRSSVSVSLHIRRSDFVNNKFHGIHGTCSIDYYKSAIDIIGERIPDMHLFIFSDDIDWAAENLKPVGPAEFISGNTGNNSYIDLQLMSNCKHNIIANSSFSWWGAWLNPNREKIVIAPKQWFIHEQLNRNTSDLLPRQWMKI